MKVPSVGSRVKGASEKHLNRFAVSCPTCDGIGGTIDYNRSEFRVCSLCRDNKYVCFAEEKRR